MRIVSGKYRSRRINPPTNLPVRPTTDMAKEALFNILQNQYDFYECTVLDLFAGTGNISYEFVSRGCNPVTAIDLNSKCIQFIKSTKDQLEMDNLNIIQSDCFGYLEHANTKFDIIFADPPYDMPDFDRIVQVVFDKQLLNDEGILIIEHSKKTKLRQFKQHLKTKNYGSVHFSFFENNSE